MGTPEVKPIGEALRAWCWKVNDRLTFLEAIIDREPPHRMLYGADAYGILCGFVRVQITEIQDPTP